MRWPAVDELAGDSTARHRGIDATCALTRALNVDRDLLLQLVQNAKRRGIDLVGDGQAALALQIVKRSQGRRTELLGRALAHVDDCTVRGERPL